MSANLSFSLIHPYKSAGIGIDVPIRLAAGPITIDITAYVDTGASFCIFMREYGDLLGLDIEAGSKMEIGQVTGPFQVYGHSVLIDTLGLKFESVVYFAKDYFMNRNVLGRLGWLDRIRLGIIHYDSHIYLSDYNEEVD